MATAGSERGLRDLRVCDTAPLRGLGTRDRMVADYARAYLDVMLSYPQLRDILAWGMVDKYSWLTDFDPRQDKTLKRGTPYDTHFRPKLLREAIAAWATRRYQLKALDPLTQVLPVTGTREALFAKLKDLLPVVPGEPDRSEV